MYQYFHNLRLHLQCMACALVKKSSAITSARQVVLPILHIKAKTKS